MSHQSLIFHLHCNHGQVTLAPGESYHSPELNASFRETASKGGRLLETIIEPNETVILERAAITLDTSYDGATRVFCNGFQSWSESREYGLEESLPTLRRIARPFMGYYGDYHFDFIKRGRGYLHSWTYTYVRRPGGGLYFIGSLGEQQGFTFFQHGLKEGQLHAERDCNGLQIDAPYRALRLWACEAPDDATAFDNWFSLMGISAPKVPPAAGWTSWYNYYTNISEAIILDNLNAFVERQLPIQIFQIDDGYQNRIGDWLEVKPAFPSGMQPVAGKIRNAGLTPGLWLAPFIAERKSRLAREHPEWLLKNEKGRAVRAGWNPLWSGWFYALDIYHPGFRKYLEKVFKTVLNDWGFSLLKLDFLYAACILPRKDKSRGAVMSEAMEWLRSLAGEQLLLGCGVPLGPAFGQVDYCRIGADIHLRWEHQLLKWLRHRERVSTILSLRSTLGRWQLSGRAFRNDPDVFLLREENIHLSSSQKRTIMLTNGLAGELLFTSDPIRLYGQGTLQAYEEALELNTKQLIKVELVKRDVYRLALSSGETALINLSTELISIQHDKQEVVLQPFESRFQPRLSI